MLGVIKINHYKFFENNKCEFYPCHKGLEKINCLFCFCPLYTFNNCGGNFKMINGIKDCSDCLIPHTEKGYDYIISKLVKRVEK